MGQEVKETARQVAFVKCAGTCDKTTVKYEYTGVEDCEMMAFMADASAFPNLTLKKIPKTVLHKCQWDQDDYSFKIDVLAEPEPLQEEEDEFELNAGDEDASDE